jgi:hypothetical protein
MGFNSTLEGLMLHMFLALDELHSMKMGYQLIAQMFVNICFVYFVIFLPHVSAHDGHLTRKG